MRSAQGSATFGAGYGCQPTTFRCSCILALTASSTVDIYLSCRSARRERRSCGGSNGGNVDRAQPLGYKLFSGENECEGCSVQRCCLLYFLLEAHQRILQPRNPFDHINDEYCVGHVCQAFREVNRCLNRGCNKGPLMGNIRLLYRDTVNLRSCRQFAELSSISWAYIMLWFILLRCPRFVIFQKQNVIYI